ncbi:hypothetical protein ACF07Y_42520 [Streptomyces sp. NPDC016566]|uniref:hypothetical protein n=1 Tax=Streptomyces sp. NPDC016566 TaxID=3364967 RepID=UPI0036FF65A8
MASKASPISSGGAGTVFEYRVAALDLVALLCGVPVPGLEVVPDAVRLQKASTAPLDDIVVSNQQGPYMLVVERQIKRTLKIAPSEKAWRGLIGQCLESLERFGIEIDADRRRLGVTATGPTEDLEALSGLAASAEAQASLEDFLEEMPRLGQRFHRAWDNLKTTVANLLTDRSETAPKAEAVEVSAFRIVRRLVVQIEPEGHSARFTALCAALDERLLPPRSRHDAAAVFRIVEGLAEKWGPRGGAVTVQMLRDRLSAHGVVLRGDPPARAALEAAERWTDIFLSRPRVKDRIGRDLVLDRTALMTELASLIDAHEMVLVTGLAGTGKSALARAVARALREQDVAVVALSLTEHAWRSVADIDGAIGERLATAVAGAPTGRRVLLIDGAEQALSDSGALLTHLVSLLPRGEDGEALWHVVAVAREQAADAVSRYLSDVGGRVHRMEVAEIADAEVREITTAFPALAALARSPRAARLLRNLYTVDLLVELAAVGADPKEIVGEEDVADCIYEHLVRRGEISRGGLGHPDDRSDVYLDLAEALIAVGDRFARVRSGTGEAREGLVSDGLLVRERSAFGFAHDVLLDYAVAVRLAEPQAPDVAAAPRPRRLLRGIRVGAQLRLTRAAHDSPAEAATAWNWVIAATQSLAGTGDARWVDLPFEALFELSRPEHILPTLSHVLLADGGRALVDTARRRLRNMESALPLLTFLTSHAPDLDEVAADGALQLLARWLPLADEADETLAAQVPKAVFTWYHAGSNWAEPAAISLACAAEHLGSSERDFLKHICDHQPEAVQRILEDARLADGMARHAPGLLAHAARACYLGPPFGRVQTSNQEGVRDVGWPVVYRPSHIPERPVNVRPPWVSASAPDPAELGPFAALLEHAKDEGLALIRQVADVATEAAGGGPEVSLVWPLTQGEAVFTGTARSWQWPWAGAPGPGPAIAALAALRRWAHHEADSGAPLAEVVEQVLGCGRNIALVAVAVEVLALQARRVVDELDPILGQLALWSMPLSPVAPLTGALQVIVPRASAERQDTFRRLAHRLETEHAYHAPYPVGFEEANRTRDSVIRHLTLLMDSSNYQLVEIPDGSGSVLVNDAIVKQRDADPDAEADLRRMAMRFELAYDAKCARDEASSLDVQLLFERWAVLDCSHQDAPPLDGPHELDSGRASVAAVVVRAAVAKTGRVERWQLRWAIRELMTAAAKTPSTLVADGSIMETEKNSMAPDRSAAKGLPLLLTSPELHRVAGVTGKDLQAALLRLAGSTYIEVRSMLCTTINHTWGHASCSGPEDPVHVGGLAILAELVATAGLAPEESIDLPHEPYGIAAPLEVALTEAMPLLDLRLAAHAAAATNDIAAGADCPHREQARALAGALSVHDRLTWTKQSRTMAKHAVIWRRTHDVVTAQVALDGDRARLDAYLDAFDSDQTALAGLLIALAGEATSTGRVRSLLALWPELLDRYGPRTNDEHLGRALLPLPVGGTHWTSAQVRGLTKAWARINTAQPQLADHFISVLDAHGLFGSQEVTQVLNVLGDDAPVVATSAHQAIPFLTGVLTDDAYRHGPDAKRARELLDLLAARGDKEALAAQHQLEESSGLN